MSPIYAHLATKMPLLERQGPRVSNGTLVSPSGHILFIDAYDSFSENIIAMLRQTLHVQITSVKIDSIRHPENEPSSRRKFAEYLDAFDAVVVGPGPGHPAIPEDIGIISDVWKVQGSHVLPVLGICLGFQSLCLEFGGRVTRLSLPCHGHVQTIHHEGTDIFEGVGQLDATNYHSLHVSLDNSERQVSGDRKRHGSSIRPSSPLSDSGYDSPMISSRASSVERGRGGTLQALAWTENNVLMAVKHDRKPFWGVQFHPESCKSGPACQSVIRNWWQKARQWNLENDRSPVSSPPVSDPEGLSSTAETQQPLLAERTPVAESGIWASLISLTETSGKKVFKVPIQYHDDLPLDVLDMISVNDVSGMTAVLESTKAGRYSIFACPSPVVWRIDYFTITKTTRLTSQNHNDRGNNIIHADKVNALDVMSELVARKQLEHGPGESPFWGGFMGFLSYEMGMDKYDIIQQSEASRSEEPDLSFLWVERCIILDHQSRSAWVQSIRKDDEHWLHTTEALFRPAPSTTDVDLHENVLAHRAQLDSDFENSLANAGIVIPDHKRYKEDIRRCQQYLLSGDSYELCLTAETVVELPKPQSKAKQDSSHSLALYRRLRKVNPVPFAAYLALGDMRVASASPEQFLTWSREGQIDMIPMKGTVKKSKEMTFDRACEILASPKEQAENLMIADLIRHDLYSLFQGESDVDVIKLCDVVEHETVYQLVSHIRTTIPQTPGATDVGQRSQILSDGQRAIITTLPPGSMTGAPKQRSCELLANIEKRRRGIYSGAIGFIDLGGNGAFSVCIRTAFCQSSPETETETWRIGAGGAITVLSDEDAEWEEMETKLDSILKAFRPGS